MQRTQKHGIALVGNQVLAKADSWHFQFFHTFFGIEESRNDIRHAGFTLNMNERNSKSFGRRFFVGLLLVFCVFGLLAVVIVNLIRARAIGYVHELP